MVDDSSGNVPVEIHVGSHLFRWEPPDIGYVAYIGDMDGKTMADFNEKSRKYTEGKPRVFLIVNLAKAGRVSAEARKVSANGSKDLAFRGIAIVAASPSLRVFAGLATRAIEILSGNMDNPTRFFEAEEEARAWIGERRRVLEGR